MGIAVVMTTMVGMVVGIVVVGMVVLAHDGVDMMVVKMIPWNG